MNTRTDILTRRAFARLMAAGLLTVAAGENSVSAAPVLAAEAQSAKKPNVLFIICDDLRPIAGCYGGAAKTPHMDALAKDGVLFRAAYCQQAICAPSRASFLTGLRPDTTGIYDLAHPVRENLPDVVTLPQRFKENGYTTVGFGKVYHHSGDDKANWTRSNLENGHAYVGEGIRAWQKSRRTEAKAKELKGWDAWNYSLGPAIEKEDKPDTAYEDGEIADAAVQELRGFAKSREPFLMCVGFRKPHLPFAAPKKYWDMYDRTKITVPDRSDPTDTPRMSPSNWEELRAYRNTPPTGVMSGDGTNLPSKGDLSDDVTRELIHGYLATVSFADAQVGKVLAELKATGLDENTVIVLIGDHGFKLGEYGDWAKHTNFELDVNSTLIVRTPKRMGLSRGAKTDAFVELVDIFPTLADLCGFAAPEKAEGISFRPVLKAPKRQWKKAAFSQYPRGKENAIMGRSVRAKNWRYTEWRERDGGKLLARELHDLKEGPVPKANLAEKPEHAATVREMETILTGGWRKALPEGMQGEETV